jgi:diamine N-acetyltransferase
MYNKNMIIEVKNYVQIEIVEQLAIEIWNEYFVPIIGKAQVDYMLEKFQSKQAISQQIKEDYLYFLIESDEEFVGYFAVLPKEDELFLSKLYIKSRYRKKGFGREALKFIEQLAHNKGPNKITLTVNKNNHSTIRAYQKMGFKNVSASIKDIGGGFVMDDFLMEKKIQ